MSDVLKADSLRQLLDYDPATGSLFWRRRDISLFAGDLRACRSWNARWAEKEAFTSKNNHGYKVGSIFGKISTAHRIIWIIAHGENAESQIDHINGDRADNRLCNLRKANNSENHKNQRLPSTNKSGAIGVHMDKRWGTWRAEIFDKGTRFYLGSFKTIDAAISARQEAEAKLKYHPNHGKR